VLNFFVLKGDVNRNRSVGPEDFNLLASNFGLTGRTYGQGDLDGDGSVGPGDFNILASNFGHALPAAGLAAEEVEQKPLPAPEAATASAATAVTDGKPARKQPRRVASALLSAEPRRLPRG
jgi:hypothetical protein